MPFPTSLQRQPHALITALLLLLPTLAAMALYLPVLGHGFVWDEQLVFVNSPLYRTSTSWIEALQQPLVLFENYYRPLTLLGFMVEMRLSGEPFLFHLTNLVLHGVNVTLVTLLAFRLGQRLAANGNRPLIVALLVGAFYGLHPALVEGVSWISSRYDLQVALFLLLALLADISLRSTVARATVVAGAFFLAALSKEIAAPFPLALAAWHLATAPRDEGITRCLRRNLPLYLALFGAGLLYLGLRIHALGGLGAAGAPLEHSLGQHVALIATTLLEYLKLIIWPFSGLGPIHHHPLPVDPSSAKSWIALAVCSALFSLPLLIRAAPAAGWLASAATLTLLPTLNLIPLPLVGPSIAAERYLLFPLALVALMGVPLALALKRRHAFIGSVLITLWMAASAANVHVTAPLWHDDRTLWRWAALTAPDSPVPHANLAMTLAEAGEAEGAVASATRALTLAPRSTMALRALAHAAMSRGQYAEALGPLEHAIALSPKDADLWNQLGAALQHLGDPQAAESSYRQALALAPENPATHANLATLYGERGDRERADAHYRKALMLLPPEEATRLRERMERIESEKTRNDAERQPSASSNGGE